MKRLYPRRYQFILRFSTGDLSPGEYMMVARGDISGLTAVGMCQLHE